MRTPLALNERFPGTKSYFLSRGFFGEVVDNNKFGIIVHVEGDAPFAQKSESESPTTTSKAMIPKLKPVLPFDAVSWVIIKLVLSK
ncbi:unnamed protein product [Bathycoccus prasinos]